MSQDNIFQEIDEELRSDRMRALWRRFGPYVIGAAVAVVALVAVNEGWSWYHANNAAQSSDELYAAFDLIDGGDLPAAQSQLDTLIADGSGSYPVLAQFRKAGVMAREGATADAVAAYDELANTQSNPRLRELALVLGATLMVDAGSLADVDSRAGSIAAEGGPLRNAAREALGLAQYKAGDFAAAQTSFEAVVNDPLTQSNTRNRMGYYLAQLLSQGAIAEAPAADAEAAASAIDEIVSDEAPAAETPAADAPAATTEAEPVAE
ncbi:tetratricopeptide repeat protein [Devosia ginsengisoli]|uniref:Tetratricopeptide repeat protein n=1 Tax=Devosia ginsengisoli TaxID=400770 RepID=A0A5B8LND9_9HYPH|nr:tetratricopeptide repeat protein [Devosia ginsengisoli]QDZ09807.1 tetratricopeptide repeat protein [Devosia ginsengisoli]